MLHPTLVCMAPQSAATKGTVHCPFSFLRYRGAFLVHTTLHQASLGRASLCSLYIRTHRCAKLSVSTNQSARQDVRDHPTLLLWRGSKCTFGARAAFFSSVSTGRTRTALLLLLLLLISPRHILLCLPHFRVPYCVHVHAVTNHPPPSRLFSYCFFMCRLRRFCSRAFYVSIY